MKIRVATFFLLFSLFCCTAQTGWSQAGSVADKPGVDPKEIRYQKAFSSFMQKARNKSFDRREKQKKAKEYSTLIEQMDELYHGSPQPKTSQPGFSLGPNSLAHAVVKVCKGDQE